MTVRNTNIQKMYKAHVINVKLYSSSLGRHQHHWRCHHWILSRVWRMFSKLYTWHQVTEYPTAK
jgi:hypothetical protein